MSAIVNLSSVDLGIKVNPDFSSLLGNFDSLLSILWIVPLFVVVWFILKKKFVKVDGFRSRKNLQRYVMLSRTLIFLFLLIAIASPYVEKEKTVKGDPYVKVIVDNSSSFGLFERGIGEKLKGQLDDHIGVELSYLGSSDRSDIGDGILRNLEADSNLLLITDGNNNYGADIGDVALYASRLNATLNAISIDPVSKDVSIYVVGPDKVSADVENTFTVRLSRAGDTAPKLVTVTLDGEKIIDQAISTDEVSFTRAFSSGYHKIVAALNDEDTFMENNVYYKTIRVVKKPEVLFYIQVESPFTTLLEQIYHVEVTNNLNLDLKKYHAVVVNNIHSKELDVFASKLGDYVSNGNGLVFVGGSSSYDNGNYKGSLSETLLPVFVGTAGKKEGDVNVVILIDISSSTGGRVGGVAAVDIEKALALGILDTLGGSNSVGIAAFDTSGYLVEPLSLLQSKNRVELDGKIKTLKHGGGTMISSGISTATNMLRSAPGSKNIVLISDGRTRAENLAINSVKKAADLGIKIYTVGVGDRTNRPFMKELAGLGGGVYFDADKSNRLKILFGEPDDEKKEEYVVTILDDNHFITEGLEIGAPISGFNSVVPKNSARLLATTDSGDPILSVWRFGLGRTASLSTDDGTQWAGSLLSKENSVLLTRTLNWVIGDPERKSEKFVSIGDTKINEPAEIVYKGSEQPIAENVLFYKVGDDIYSASIIPDSTGFKNLLGATFAVNYNREYELVGLNPGLQEIVGLTGGKMFDKENIDGIAEQARTLSKRIVFGKVYYRWPFILAAILLFLLEIFLRRLSDSKTKEEVIYERH